jgi:N-acetylmuramoyl-L-alanine amidase
MRSEAMRQRPSPNHDERPAGRSVDMLLIHYTGMPSAAAALDRLCDPAAKVSAHYLIEEDGALWQLVPEERRAWHAGLGFWAGAADINARSIGIELQNPGHEFGYRPFPTAQMRALIKLARGILGRHAIPAWRVLGHADTAPARKQDPGELFDWRRLAAVGIGLWPDDKPADGTDTRDWRALMARFGYDMRDPAAALTAFRRHFEPEALDKPVTRETCRRLARLVAALPGA